MATTPNPSPTCAPKRFALQLPLEFRPHGSDQWWQAETDNISINGALFHTSKQVPPHTPLDVKLQLPNSLTGLDTLQLLCSGYAVRWVEPRPPCENGQLAATFLTYKLSDTKTAASADLGGARSLPALHDVAKLVHRLNTLLFVILGRAELLSLDPGDESKVRDVSNQIRRSAEEAAGVVRSMANTYPPNAPVR
jgi:hypothetical protein